MELSGKKILITGGTGFIGSALAQRLAPANAVTLLARRDISQSAFDILCCDVSGTQFRDALVSRDWDIIFHFAANTNHQEILHDPRVDIQDNLLPAFTLLDAYRVAARKPHIVFASSVMVYGNSKEHTLSEEATVPMPIANYGVSKLCSEHYLYTFFRQYGIPGISLRFFSTYGPGLRRQIIFDFISKLSNNPSKLDVIGDGTHVRDLVYIDDQVENILSVVASAEFHGEAYNMGSGKGYSVREIAEIVAEVMHAQPVYNFDMSQRVFDGARWVADTSRIQGFGCRTNIDLSEGVRRTVKWYTSTFV